MAAELAADPNNTVYRSDIRVGDTLYLKFNRPRLASRQPTVPAGAKVIACAWEPPGSRAGGGLNLLVQTEDGARFYVHTQGVSTEPPQR